MTMSLSTETAVKSLKLNMFKSKVLSVSRQSLDYLKVQFDK